MLIHSSRQKCMHAESIMLRILNGWKKSMNKIRDAPSPPVNTEESPWDFRFRFVISPQREMYSNSVAGRKWPQGNPRILSSPIIPLPDLKSFFSTFLGRASSQQMIPHGMSLDLVLLFQPVKLLWLATRETW